MKVNLRKLVPPIATFLFGFILFIIIPANVSVAKADPPILNSRFFPYFIAIVIMLCSVTDFIGVMVSERKSRTLPATMTDGKKSGLIRMGLALFSLVVWILILRTVGFLISTMLLSLAIMLLVGSRNKIALVALPVILSVVTYAVFYYFVGVNLPAGLFGL